MHAEEPDYARNGWYLGTALAGGFEKSDLPGTVDDAVGFDFWAGYRVSRVLAFEAQFEYLNGFSGAGAGDFIAATANLKFYLLHDRIQPFLAVGAGVGRIDAGRGWIVRFGSGADLWLTENIALVAAWSYVFTTQGVDDRDYVSITAGAQYRF